MLKRSLETLASAIKMWVNDKFTHSHKEISNQIQEVMENLSIEVPVTSVNGMTGDVIINPTPADWGQNKETEVDYIKNRTHYVYHKEMFSEKTIYIPGGSTQEYSYLSNDLFIYGKKYLVIINGCEYLCTVGYQGPGGVSYYHDFICDDNILPFNLRTYASGLNVGDGVVISMYGVNNPVYGKYTISIFEAEETVKKIDEKYLPDGIMLQPDFNQNDSHAMDHILNRTHWIGPGYSSILSEPYVFNFIEDGSLTSKNNYVRYGYGAPDNFSLSEGEKYRVIWDGQEYNDVKCYCKYFQNSSNRGYSYYLGNPELSNIDLGFKDNLSLPFLIWSDVFDWPTLRPSIGAYSQGPEPRNIAADVMILDHNVKVYHPLDERFIPDTIARISDIAEGGGVQADFTQNDETQPDYVKNRTHYVEREGWEITWDGNVDNVEIKVIPQEEEPEDMLCYISSDIPSDEQLKEAFMLLVNVDSDGIITQRRQIEIADFWNDFMAAGYVTDDFAFLDGACVAKRDNVDIFGIILPKAGVYFAKMGSIRTYKLGLAPIIKKLDSKFLPDDIVGRKGAGTNAEVFNDYDDTNTASGDYSHVEGQGNTASGDYSHVEGRNNTTSGFGSHVEGVGNTASGLCSHAEGYQTTSYEYSHAEGYYTLAGYRSHAEGSETYAYAGSHAEGSGTVACGGQSHAEGRGWKKRSLTLTGSSRTYKYTDNDVDLSIVGMIVVNDTGNTCWSAKIIAVDLGTKTITIDGKLCPNAMDTKTLPVYSVGVASGSCSHAEGYTIAHGDYSHAEGYYTIASGANQHVQGKYNIDDMKNEYAHIVGNGENDDHRSNAHALDWDGNAWYAGNVYIGSTSGTNRDEGSKKLATEEYVNSAIETNTSSQVDWNQNDETASDYIKGRTHWVEDPGEEVLSEVTKSFEWEDDSNYAYDTVGTARYPMVVGESYILSINGVEYERVAQAYGSDQVFIGDRNVFSGNGYFLLTYYMNSNELHLRIMADGDLTLRVVKKGQRELVYHTLDEKFIPDTIARVSDIPDIPDPVDLTGYATEEYVDNTIKQIIPEGGYSVSWENITNKPFTTFTVAGPSTEFEEFYSNPSAELYEDSEGYELNHHRSLIEVRNEDCADFCMLEDGKTYKVAVDGYEGIAVAEKVAGVYNDDEAIVQLTLELNNRRIIVNTSDGIYTTGRGVERICRLSVCIYYNDSSDFYNGFIYVPIAIYKPKGVVVLDEKHIPDTVARKADVAKEVQAVMVSGDAKIFLTSPGGKKFAITITDDGTISATEVIE